MQRLGRLPTSWRKFALCSGHDPELWFLVSQDGGAKAVAICTVCPVRLDCLDWALEHHERGGIWGGISARRREQMRAHARAAVGRPREASLGRSLEARRV